MRRFLLLAAALCATSLAAGAAAPPYMKLAQALGTPKLADSYGTSDKTQLLLKFVAYGESLKKWTKMTTVSIVQVPASETSAAASGLVTHMRAVLSERRVKVVRFDKDPSTPASAYFEFEANGERDKGVIYSPHEGFVTVAQISAKGGGAISSADVQTLRSIVGRR